MQLWPQIDQTMIKVSQQRLKVSYLQKDTSQQKMKKKPTAEVDKRHKRWFNADDDQNEDQLA